MIVYIFFRYVGLAFFTLFFIAAVALIINFYFSYVHAPRSPKEKLNQRSNNTYDENYDIGGQEHG